jgi:hypothetical protein
MTSSRVPNGTAAFNPELPAWQSSDSAQQEWQE